MARDYTKEIEALKAKIAELETEMRSERNAVEIIQQVKMDDFEEVGEWQMGDIIRFTLLTGEEVEAQCQRVDPEGATFFLTHCLEDERPMNHEDTNEGGWDESDLREYLNTSILSDFPDAIRKHMKPIYKDDLLTLPAVEDIFGDWDYENWEPKAEGLNNRNWPLMEKRQNRCKGTWWWERSANATNATHFCSVNTGGNANYTYASYSFGLAPAFLIGNPD